MLKGTEVFSSLAQDYAQYRPGYPSEVMSVLANDCGLTQESIIADIGSGTGNSAKLFLEAGYQIIGVEPNREMREFGERLLAEYPKFTSLEGSAESIPLDNKSIDLIIVGQAVHWFDIDRAKVEFHRILRPGGWVAVMWNDRRSDVTLFTKEYEAITSKLAALHPSQCNSRSISSAPECILDKSSIRTANFPHTQSFDLQGLLGRARSSGFVPQPENSYHKEATALITDLFSRHQKSGQIEFHYITRLYFGHISVDCL